MPEYVNKDYYRQLAPDDRSFLNLTAQNIRTVMDRLNAENSAFYSDVQFPNINRFCHDNNIFVLIFCF